MPKRTAFTLIELIVVLVIIAGLLALLFPAVQTAKGASKRLSSKSHLMQLALGAHNYHDKYSTFPSAYIIDEERKPFYSWRVLLLPYIEQQNLYEQFKTNESWDSEHNLTLLKKANLIIFDIPPDNSWVYDKWIKAEHEFASYAMIVGKDTISGGSNSVKRSGITDGISNTIMFAETRQKIPWSAPRDVLLESLNRGITIHGKLGTTDNGIGSLRKKGNTFVVFADGSVQELSPKMSPEILKSLAIINDGKPITGKNGEWIIQSQSPLQGN